MASRPSSCIASAITIETARRSSNFTRYRCDLRCVRRRGTAETASIRGRAAAMERRGAALLRVVGAGRSGKRGAVLRRGLLAGLDRRTEGRSMKVRLLQPWQRWSKGHVFTEMPASQAQYMVERDMAEY